MLLQSLYLYLYFVKTTSKDLQYDEIYDAVIVSYEVEPSKELESTSMYSVAVGSGEVEDFIETEQFLLTASDYQRDDRRINDELDKDACRGGFHCSEKVSELRRFLCVLVPEVVKQIALGGESVAGNKEMLKVARDAFTRTEETVPLLIG